MRSLEAICRLIVSMALVQPAVGLSMERGDDLRIIPRPLEMLVAEGQFCLTSSSSVYHESGLVPEARYLAEALRGATGYAVPIERLPADIEELPPDAIALLLKPSLGLGDEGYHLETTPLRVVIEADRAAGVFYGIQSLLQLLPPEVASRTMVQGVDWVIPVVRIKDKPRFPWRAYMLDEARWFKGVADIERLLDQMALHKMNVFHWHLTDDQGWRIEIRRYPRLTEIGSRRKDTQAGGWRSEERTGQPHEGFYTQDEIRHIVRYAADRHITIVPEIEMPGHASAAIAAYPQIGTSGRTIDVPVTFGKMHDTYNVADERTYAFLEGILDEVLGLFPSSVIHIGGDEVRFDHWLSSPQVQALMERESLPGPAQVQLFFTNRMSRFVESRGRRMMGWNDILGDDLHGFIEQAGGREMADEADGRSLAPNAIVHFWKGSLELARRAVEGGHDIVNSLHSSTYLDYSYERISLESAYGFEPVPDGLEEQYHHHILGLGCQMWSEWTPTRERVEYQTFPRLSAFAEVGWTARERKDYDGFVRRLEAQGRRWDITKTTYGPIGPRTEGAKP